MNKQHYNPIVIRVLIVITLLSLLYVMYICFNPIGYNRLCYSTSCETLRRNLNFYIYSYANTTFEPPKNIDYFIKYVENLNDVESLKASEHDDFFAIARNDVLKYLNKRKKYLKFKNQPFEDKYTLSLLLYRNHYVSYGYADTLYKDSTDISYLQFALYSASFKDAYGNNYYSAALKDIIKTNIKQINNKYINELSLNHKASISSNIRPIIYIYNRGELNDFISKEEIDTSAIYFRRIYNLPDSIATCNDLSQIICSNECIEL